MRMRILMEGIRGIMKRNRMVWAAALLVLYFSLWYAPPAERRARFALLAPAASTDRILVVAPHIDDEALAAAGFLRVALERGAQVYVVYLTSGDGNRFSAAILDRTIHLRPADLLREGAIRMREAVQAMAVLGIPPGHLFFLGYPDGGLRPMLTHPEALYTSPRTREHAVPYRSAFSPGALYTGENLRRDLLRVLCLTRPTFLIVPVPFDAHPDHQAAGILINDLLSTLDFRPNLLGYLVHAHLFPRPFALAPHHPLLPPPQFLSRPWRIFPLPPGVEEEKHRALAKYVSQRKSPFLLALLDSFVRKNELFLEERANQDREGGVAGPCGGARGNP